MATTARIVMALDRVGRAGSETIAASAWQPVDGAADSNGPAALEDFQALLLFGEPALTRSQLLFEAVDRPLQ